MIYASLNCVIIGSGNGRLSGIKPSPEATLTFYLEETSVIFVNQNMNGLVHGNVLEKVAWKMSAILLGRRCVKWTLLPLQWYMSQVIHFPDSCSGHI